MQKILSVGALAFLFMLSSCSSHTKKIILFANSSIQLDESGKNITITEGTTHHEKELVFNGTDPVTLQVQTPAGKVTLQAADDGLYIANLQKDTIVGSFQHIGADNGKVTLTTDLLKQKVDSLGKLTQGLNVSAVNRNYFIPPSTLSRITPVTAARVFGPYTTVPSGFDASSVPEIYKFYTNKEIREIMGRLSGIGK